MTNQYCKVCKTELIVKQTRRTLEQLKKQYYYTAYNFCPKCGRIYHDEKFKIVNETDDLFAVKEIITHSPVDIEIWTDGASSNNGKPHAKAAWAFVAGDYEEAGLVDGKQTNNRGEAWAIYHALRWAVGRGYKRITIHTDSQITIHGVMKSPDRVKENRDIFQQIHEVISQNQLQVDYQKVLGHSGDQNNERADKLAVKLTMS